jgi:LCP family protein required for cell wall assembly
MSISYLPAGQPYSVPPRPRYRRRPRRLAAFVQGLLIGYGTGGVLLVIMVISLVLFFPPRRTEILILGLDRRPSEKTTISRTDTMILVTVNPAANYAGMLSIPRDLYLTMPGGFLDRINDAYVYAEIDTPASGPAAAMQTVRTNFGVDVQRYMQVDLAGFVNIVDALGGIDLNVPQAIFDDAYPTYNYGTTTVSFAAGPQQMDGEQALAYARIRHGSSDLQRAERQQRVIQALFARLLRPAAWVRLPIILGALRISLATDLSPVDVLRLAPTLLRVGPANIEHVVIEGDMVEPYTTAGGADVLLPVWARINPVLLRMFGQ